MYSPWNPTSHLFATCWHDWAANGWWGRFLFSRLGWTISWSHLTKKNWYQREWYCCRYVLCANVQQLNLCHPDYKCFWLPSTKSTWNITLIAWQLNRYPGTNWSLQWWWINMRRGGRLNANWPACQLEWGASFFVSETKSRMHDLAVMTDLYIFLENEPPQRWQDLRFHCYLDPIILLW